MKPGVFDTQGIGTTDYSRFLRKLGVLEDETLWQVEAKMRNWLRL
jgi:hypothetical protein